MTEYSKSEPYKLFRSWVPQQRISVDNSSLSWKFYEYGPKESIPLIFIPGTGGTAEVFYKQFISLCVKGYHLISVQSPNYMTHLDWCKGFDRFLDKLNLNNVHLFGTSLGGYLAQCYAQHRPKRVLSLILCNSFSDTQFYKDHAPCAPMFSLMPEFMLKRFLLQSLPTSALEASVADSIDFMVSQIDSMTHQELASRLTLNCTVFEEFNPAQLPIDKSKITIIDCLDEVAIPLKLREEVYKLYPEAKVCEMKVGGNFPYLSRPDEVNLYLEVHLRNQGLFANKPILEVPNNDNNTESSNQETTTKSSKEEEEEK